MRWGCGVRVRFGRRGGTSNGTKTTGGHLVGPAARAAAAARRKTAGGERNIKVDNTHGAAMGGPLGVEEARASHHTRQLPMQQPPGTSTAAACTGPPERNEMPRILKEKQRPGARQAGRRPRPARPEGRSSRQARASVSGGAVQRSDAELSPRAEVRLPTGGPMHGCHRRAPPLRTCAGGPSGD